MRDVAQVAGVSFKTVSRGIGRLVGSPLDLAHRPPRLVVHMAPRALAVVAVAASATVRWLSRRRAAGAAMGEDD